MTAPTTTTPIQPVRKAVFPVAGLGTRLLPATKVMPKEMLTIVDRPLIQMAVEEAMAAGVTEFIFVISEGKETLLRHFETPAAMMEMLELRGKTKEIEKVKASTLPQGSLKTAMQPKALGLGHAVWCAREIVGNEPFAVLLPDDTVRHPVGCLSQMVTAYNEVGGNVVAAVAVNPEETSKYGILDVVSRDGRNLSLRGLVEKPAPADAPSNMSIFGRYILQPQIFAHLERHEKGAGGEIQLTDAMARLLAEQDFTGYEFEGERIDCGSDIGFIKAQIAYGLDRAHLSQDILDYMIEKIRAYAPAAAASSDAPARDKAA